MQTKVSCGVAICRYNHKKNNQVEIIMVKKRYSYAFRKFVMGYYKNNVDIVHLLNGMTFSEKIDILHLQYSQLWYRLWLNDPERHISINHIYNIQENETAESDLNSKYFNKKNKFEALLADGGRKLQNMIKTSHNQDSLWEVPKGHLNNGESPLDCAKRETTEETLVKCYENIMEDPVVGTYVDENIKYKNIYYIAECADFEPVNNFSSYSNVIEVERIKWVSLQEIQFLYDGTQYAYLGQLFKRLVKRFKRLQKLKAP